MGDRRYNEGGASGPNGRSKHDTVEYVGFRCLVVLGLFLKNDVDRPDCSYLVENIERLQQSCFCVKIGSKSRDESKYHNNIFG